MSETVPRATELMSLRESVEISREIYRNGYDYLVRDHKSSSESLVDTVILVSNGRDWQKLSKAKKIPSLFLVIPHHQQSLPSTTFNIIVSFQNYCRQIEINNSRIYLENGITFS